MRMDVTSELLEKYVSGACTEAEEVAVRKWLDAAEENEDILVGVPFPPHLEVRLREKIKKASANKMKEKKAIPPSS